MHLSLAYSLLVQQEFWNKNRFDVLATTLQLMDEEDTESGSEKLVIDLTMDDNSVAKFVDLSKDPEVFDLCSSSSSSAGVSSSARSLTSSSASAIMPRGLLNSRSSDSSDSDISSAGTDGHPGLPHPQLIGTLIKVNKRQGEEDVTVEPSNAFFLAPT